MGTTAAHAAGRVRPGAGPPGKSRAAGYPPAGGRGAGQPEACEGRGQGEPPHPGLPHAWRTWSGPRGEPGADSHLPTATWPDCTDVRRLNSKAGMRPRREPPDAAAPWSDMVLPAATSARRRGAQDRTGRLWGGGPAGRALPHGRCSRCWWPAVGRRRSPSGAWPIAAPGSPNGRRAAGQLETDCHRSTLVVAARPCRALRRA